MKSLFVAILFSIYCISGAFSQTLTDAKKMYLDGEYEKALPVFEAEYNAKPNDPNLNQWYGVCLFQTDRNLPKAEECLLNASKKRIPESFFYLGKLYTQQYRFKEAEDAFSKYGATLKKRDTEAHARLEDERKIMSRLHRLVSNTEDIQIIDSLVVDKASFLSAYKLSRSSGKLDYFNAVFSSNKKVQSVVYANEKGTKIYYGQPDNDKTYTLFSMDKLLDEFANEKKLSANNFGLTGDINYPYVMSDGVTIYFSAKDEESLGGYDLFVSRYNTNTDTYLTPERLSMPFNSLFNDYMMAVDEEKGVGWFASDRYQPEGKVCVYTFIPNKVVKVIQSDDEAYLSARARISSIKKSWVKGQSYSSLIALARKTDEEKTVVVRDFEFVIDDNHTYYRLADFTAPSARDTYYKVMGLKRELQEADEKLSALRNNYSESNQAQKQKISTDILSLERQVERLQAEIPTLELQVRALEVKTLK